MKPVLKILKSVNCFIFHKNFIRISLDGIMSECEPHEFLDVKKGIRDFYTLFKKDIKVYTCLTCGYTDIDKAMKDALDASKSIERINRDRLQLEAEFNANEYKKKNIKKILASQIRAAGKETSTGALSLASSSGGELSNATSEGALSNPVQETLPEPPKTPPVRIIKEGDTKTGVIFKLS